MKMLRTVSSMATLIALGVLTSACNDKPETAATEQPPAAAEVKVSEPASNTPVMSEPEQVPAEMASATDDKPFIAMTAAEEVTAEVLAIDHQTREVTLALDEGEVSCRAKR